MDYIPINYNFFMCIAKNGYLEDVIPLDSISLDVREMNTADEYFRNSGTFTYSARPGFIHPREDTPVNAIHLIYDIAKLIKYKEKLEAEIKELKVPIGFEV